MHFDEAFLAVFIIHYGAFKKLFFFLNFTKKREAVKIQLWKDGFYKSML